MISVGNLSVGGTGKTPIVSAMAQWLVARGERPAILSRGYRRTRPLEGVTVVSDGAHVLADVATAGDEPLMLARQAPGAAVCVAADRFLAGTLAEERLGCTVHVLDDGFQHFGLHRDLDVLVSGPGEIAAGRVLPMGCLREPIEAASRAHVLVVVGGDASTAAADARRLGIGASLAATRIVGTPRLVKGDRASVSTSVVPEPDAGPVVAVAGIASPGQFFDSLRAQGWVVSRECAFPDHHVFTGADIARVAREVSAAGAALVLTTEKDAVRFEACGALPFALGAVPMTMTFDPWETLERAMLAVLERGRHAHVDAGGHADAPADGGASR